MFVLIAVLIIGLWVLWLVFSNKKKRQKLEQLIYCSDKDKTGKAWSQLQDFMQTNGISDKKYHKVREELYLRLAETDDILALKMASAYTADEGQKFKYLLRLVQLGDVDSMYALGLKYQDQNAAGYDLKEAFKWFQKAAEYGHESAAWFTACAYYFGEGVPQDREKAFRYAKYFSDRGFPKLGFFLVDYFSTSSENPHLKENEQIVLLERIMQRGERENFQKAAMRLGYIFGSSGRNISEYADLRKAAYCFYLAYCLSEDDGAMEMENFRETGYRATQFELNTWKSDAINLRYNPH